jgi:hypothetical protein
VGEDPAAEERPERALDEARHGSLALPRAGQEGLELLVHDRVEHRDPAAVLEAALLRRITM